MSKRTESLIRDLDQVEPRARTAAEARIMALGDEASGPLLLALTDTAPRCRRSAARLLGKLKPSRAAARALRAALGDDDPKVRKLAGASLGRFGHQENVSPLIAALAGEPQPFVRVSLMLALGALGGDEALAALRALDAPESSKEVEALRKALERSAPKQDSGIKWREDRRWQWTTALEAPVGFAAIAEAEAAERGWPMIKAVGPGHLRVPAAVAPWQLSNALRCVHRLRVLLKNGPPLDPHDIDEAAVAQWLGSQTRLKTLREWLDVQGDARYRLALIGPNAPKRIPRGLLNAARSALTPLGMVDSPSNYDLELVIGLDPGGAQLSLRPSFDKDRRFEYRQRDVGASIQPVLGACLARLVRTGKGAHVRDPTCGSGTLLIERARLGQVGGLTGVDCSRTAIAASSANATAAGLEDDIKLIKADAASERAWKPCDEVIANLPFGVRTHKQHNVLKELYTAILGHIAANLSEHGRVVLYTSVNRVLEESIRSQRRVLRVTDRLYTRAGGLDVTAFVLERSLRR